MDRNDRILAALAAKPDSVLESIARELSVSTQTVLEMTPENERLLVSAHCFDEIWHEISDLGPILFIVHTQDIVLECTGSLPAGTYDRGYYNLDSGSPIHGHIKIGNCHSIYLIDRLFHGRRTCSVQFFNSSGEPMFKIFVGRYASRELIAEQISHLERLGVIAESSQNPTLSRVE